MKIVIVIEGNMIQTIFSDEPVKVAIIDYDTDGVEKERITSIPQLIEDFPDEAYASLQSAEVSADLAASLYAACKAYSEKP
jgi:hypothetical protein